MESDGEGRSDEGSVRRESERKMVFYRRVKGKRKLKRKSESTCM